MTFIASNGNNCLDSKGVYVAPPIELVEYNLCKEFGWTLYELYQMPTRKVEKFLHIMNTYNTKENDEISKHK